MPQVRMNAERKGAFPDGWRKNVHWLMCTNKRWKSDQKPLSEIHNDIPTNGMALCGLCLWSFDEGLMSVGKKYEVLVSKRVQVQQNLVDHSIAGMGSGRANYLKVLMSKRKNTPI